MFTVVELRVAAQGAVRGDVGRVEGDVAPADAASIAGCAATSAASTAAETYVFDCGDERRVRLALAEIKPAGADPCPPILASRGEPPAHYGDDDGVLAEIA